MPTADIRRRCRIFLLTRGKIDAAVRRSGVCLGALVACFFVLTAPAFAQGPTVLSTGASNIWSDTAIISGAVDSGGLPLTSCTFTVGVDPSLSVDTSSYNCHEYQFPNGNTGASAVLGGLTPLTTYYFKLSVSTLDGSASSPTNQFMTSATPPPAPTATTDPASSVNGTSATLNGTVNAENVAVTSCEFEYGTDTSYGQTAPCSPFPGAESGDQPVSAAITGLTAGTTYHFRVVMSTEGGTTDGADKTFTPAVTGTATTGVASDVTATSATLSGSVDAQGVAGDTCSFLYGTGGTYQSAPCTPATIPASGAQNETAKVSGLHQNTAYQFEIVLSTAQGNASGAAVSFKTLIAPTGATRKATHIKASSARLNGVVNGHGVAVVACKFQYGRTPFGAGASTPPKDHTVACSPRPADSGSVPVAAVVSRLSAKTKYYFRVLFETQAGQLVTTALSFRTARTPGVRITRVRTSAGQGTATFRFKATGIKATKFECALLVVRRNGKLGRPRYRRCRSPKTYRKLAKRRYEFLVRAGNAQGWGALRTRRFTI